MPQSPNRRTFALLVGDGMADFAIESLGNKTPLEYAHTPGMDKVVRRGRIGLVATIPQGMSPGSDVANMSLLGYDPAQYYGGRAPIEAASMGLALGPRDTAFRCNLVKLDGGTMVDYSAGHIETDDARAIISELQAALGTEEIHFYPGVSYRHLLVIRNYPRGDLTCVPPHDISGKAWTDFTPRGAGSELLSALMEKARTVLAVSPVNTRRREAGRMTATDIWLWGQGMAVHFPTLAQRFALTGSVISAVDLVRGLGTLSGLNVIKVPGATGYLDTDYAAKVKAAQEALATQDFVFVHIEAPDETSHEGSLEKKLRAIEDFDARVVQEMLAFQEKTPGLRIMVLPDHATPLVTRTHASGPVPFAVCGPGIAHGKADSYSESAAQGSNPFAGPSLFEEFIRGDFA